MIDEMDFEALYKHVTSIRKLDRIPAQSFRHPANMIETRRVLDLTRMQLSGLIDTPVHIIEQIESGTLLPDQDQAWAIEDLFMDYIQNS